MTPREPEGLGARAVRELRPILSYEEPDLGVHPFKALQGVKTVACLPLVVADRPEGALYVYLHEDRPFTEIELLLLNNLVNQAAIAIYHANQVAIIQRDLSRKRDELSLLHNAGLLISSRTRLEETLEAILQMALEVTNAHYGIFRLVDRAGQHLLTRAIAGERLGSPAIEALPINTTSVMGWVAKTRRPLNIPDVAQPPWSRIYYPLDHVLDMRSELTVPLIGAGGRLEGVLNLESPEVAAFSEADSHLLQSLASQAVIAIQEVRLLDALRDTAERLLTRPTGDVLQHLTTLACDLLNIDGSGIWTLEGETLTLRAAALTDAPNTLPRLPEEMIRRAVLTGSPLTYERNLTGVKGWKRGLVTPILSALDQKPVGALAVYSDDEQAESDPAEWDKKVMGILAHYAALALENETHQRALRAAEEARAVAETFAAMGDVAANLLHHLNNKVGTIPVRIEGIQDKCAPLLEENPYLASNLIEIERAALDAMAAVRERLSLLRPIDIAPTAVGPCVEDALAQAGLPPSIAVQISGLDDLPPVMAGREGLTLALVNLLENAREAMGGEGALAITGEADADARRIVHSRRRPRHSGRVGLQHLRFQRFRQSRHAKRSRKTVALSPRVRFVVDQDPDDAPGRQHHGRERRRNRHDLPAAHPACTEPAMTPEPMRALVVEDTTAWQEILTEILTDMGLAVDVASDLDAAVALLKDRQHRVAVVDLALADDGQNRDGLEVLTTVGQLDPGCVTVLLTGFATVELAVSALTEYGAFTCLRKEAFRRAEFREVIHRALALAPVGPVAVPAAPASPAQQHATGPARPAQRGDALLVEDDAGWRSLVTEILEDAGFGVRACLSYGEALGYLRRDQFAVAIVDLSLASSTAPRDNRDGYEILRGALSSALPAIVISGLASREEVERAYAEFGIHGYVEKQSFDRAAFARLIVEAADAGGAGFGEIGSLTPREREVLTLVVRGLTNKGVAHALVISENTVKRYLKSIFEKLDVDSRAAATAKAVSSGLR